MSGGSRSCAMLILPLLLSGIPAGWSHDRPVVATPLGRLQGVTLPVKDTSRTADVFFGVPFAKPPVGPLRFANPEPPEAWESVRNACRPPPMCLQNISSLQQLRGQLRGLLRLPPLSEDCLFLNVFTPSDRHNNSRLAVMVFIHGGGLIMGGAALFDGSALSVYEDVVVVVIQYRLGVLGFLSTGDGKVAGNVGAMDQLAALRWVQENIRSFGGDPASVTVFGQSAGALAVTALVMSPMARGLFHRAIAQSGVPLLPGFVANSARDLVVQNKLLADISGCEGDAMMDCLMEKTEEEMMEMSLIAFPLSVDGQLLPQPVEEMLIAGQTNDVAVMVGANDDEFGWTIPQSMNVSGLTDGMDRKLAERNLHNLPYAGFLSDFVPLILEEYLEDVDDPLEIRDRFLELCGDLVFIMPALKFSRYLRDAGLPVFLYEFRHRPFLFRDTKPHFVSADHGDELLFVGGGPFLNGDQIFSSSPGAFTEEEKTLSKVMMKYWAAFARSGTPNGPGLVRWPRYDEDEGYLAIGTEQKSSRRLKERFRRFWMEVLPEKMRQRSAHQEL